MSVARKLRVADEQSKREAVLASFAEALEIGPIESITRRGRDPLTAPYTMRMADGKQTDVRIGTIKVLRSQPALGDVLAVKLDRMPPALEGPFWHKLVSSVVNCATIVEEVEGETYADQVLEWLQRYIEKARGTRDDACTTERPFIENNAQGLPDLHVHVLNFRAWVKEFYGSDEKAPDLRNALRDLGFERRTINYTKSGASNTRSYYVGPMDVFKQDGIIG